LREGERRVDRFPAQVIFGDPGADDVLEPGDAARLDLLALALELLALNAIAVFLAQLILLHLSVDRRLDGRRKPDAEDQDVVEEHGGPARRLLLFCPLRQVGGHGSLDLLLDGGAAFAVEFVGCIARDDQPG
jgi:hypothetical protein